MRVVFFGTGGRYSLEHFRSVLTESEPVGVVVAAPARGGVLRSAILSAARALRLRARDRLSAASAAHGIPVCRARSGSDERVARFVERLAPDLICIATYPWVLPGPVIFMPRLGSINSHPSLLPRHRGVLPLFWVYYHDDRETGVTIHWVTEEADAGDVLLQEARPLPRGFPVDQLYVRNAGMGAELVRKALRMIAEGKAPRHPQDARDASFAPRVKRGASMVNFREWRAERVWHFLAGSFPRFREPLIDARGRPANYRAVLGYAPRSGLRSPGSLEDCREGWYLHCVDGVVHLAR